MKKLIFILFSLQGILWAQISPGDLSEFHKDLEGMSNCTKCHVLGEKVNNSKCLDCHEQIKNLIDLKRGYHSSSEVKDKDCASCHPEHFGRDFEIIRLDKDKFDHNTTGFKLDGKHKEIKCEECHKPDFIKDSKLKKKKGTYLGMGRDCKSCHQDFHQGTLGDDCASCHNTDEFRPAPKFDHNNAKFKLTGKHIDTSCEKCHKKTTRNNKEFQQFVNIKFASCENCHKDIHDGKFGKDCTKCHVTSSFTQIKNKDKFDHSKTNFPLVGKHITVGCSDCHGSKLSSKPKHQYCIDCHKDFHKGEISKKNSVVQDCAVCHTVDGFSPSFFTIEDHFKLDFKLEGSHLAVPCASCHYEENKWKFDFESTNCADCHDNIHDKFMSAKFTDAGCENCHSVESWHSIREFDHNKTKFELVGKHQDVNCGKCHLSELGNIETQKFKDLTHDCEDCHEDIHFGQFKEDDKTDCSRCHTPENWVSLKFDHETTRFPLKGAHSKVQCFECHKIVKSGTNRYVQFKIEDIRCASCHS